MEVGDKYFINLIVIESCPAKLGKRDAGAGAKHYQVHELCSTL
jgi:hypothetical protein